MAMWSEATRARTFYALLQQQQVPTAAIHEAAGPLYDCPEPLVLGGNRSFLRVQLARRSKSNPWSCGIFGVSEGINWAVGQGAEFWDDVKEIKVTPFPKGCSLSQYGKLLAGCLVALSRNSLGVHLPFFPLPPAVHKVLEVHQSVKTLGLNWGSLDTTRTLESGLNQMAKLLDVNELITDIDTEQKFDIQTLLGAKPCHCFSEDVSWRLWQNTYNTRKRLAAALYVSEHLPLDLLAVWLRVLKFAFWDESKAVRDLVTLRPALDDNPSPTKRTRHDD
jgi:hypothetical protein